MLWQRPYQTERPAACKDQICQHPCMRWCEIRSWRCWKKRCYYKIGLHRPLIGPKLVYNNMTFKKKRGQPPFSRKIKSEKKIAIQQPAFAIGKILSLSPILSHNEFLFLLSSLPLWIGQFFAANTLHNVPLVNFDSIQQSFYFTLIHWVFIFIRNTPPHYTHITIYASLLLNKSKQNLALGVWREKEEWRGGGGVLKLSSWLLLCSILSIAISVHT